MGFRRRQFYRKFLDDLLSYIVLDRQQLFILEIDCASAENLVRLGVNQLIRDSQIIAIANEVAGQQCIHIQLGRDLRNVNDLIAILLNCARWPDGQ